MTTVTTTKPRLLPKKSALRIGISVIVLIGAYIKAFLLPFEAWFPLMLLTIAFANMMLMITDGFMDSVEKQRKMVDANERLSTLIDEDERIIRENDEQIRKLAGTCDSYMYLVNEMREMLTPEQKEAFYKMAERIQPGLNK